MPAQQNRQELMRFVVTGCLAVATDFIGYYLLLGWIPIDTAKGVSFLLGSIVAFVLNKIWTFESDKKLVSAAINFAVLYGLTFLANVLVNHLVLAWIVEIKIIGFLFATATSTILNFIGMKYWVFRTESTSQENI